MSARKILAINSIGMTTFRGSFPPTLGPDEVLMWRRLAARVEHEPSVPDHSYFSGGEMPANHLAAVAVANVDFGQRGDPSLAGLFTAAGPGPMIAYS
jgi:hypothetical protein